MKSFIENEFMPETHAANTSHFRYYYRYINKPHEQWYDFKVADDTVFSAQRHHAIGKSSYLAPGSTKTPCMLWGLWQEKKSAAVVRPQAEKR